MRTPIENRALVYGPHNRFPGSTPHDPERLLTQSEYNDTILAMRDPFCAVEIAESLVQTLTPPDHVAMTYVPKPIVAIAATMGSRRAKIEHALRSEREGLLLAMAAMGLQNALGKFAFRRSSEKDSLLHLIRRGYELTEARGVIMPKYSEESI